MKVQEDATIRVKIEEEINFGKEEYFFFQVEPATR